jgi:hypothetical protein
MHTAYPAPGPRVDTAISDRTLKHSQCIGGDEDPGVARLLPDGTPMPVARVVVALPEMLGE